MPNETRKPPPLTLEYVIQVARDTLLEQGRHPPTVIVAGDQRTIGAQLESLAPTHEQRAQQMFSLGLALAQSAEVGVLQQVFFIAEAWMSSAAPGEALKQPPSQDPQRKEVVIIAHHVFRSPIDEVIVFEMKRDPQGMLMGLEAVSPSEKSGESEVRNPLIMAFVLGFLGSAWKPED